MPLFVPSPYLSLSLLPPPTLSLSLSPSLSLSLSLLSLISYYSLSRHMHHHHNILCAHLFLQLALAFCIYGAAMYKQPRYFLLILNLICKSMMS